MESQPTALSPSVEGSTLIAEQDVKLQLPTNATLLYVSPQAYAQARDDGSWPEPSKDLVYNPERNLWMVGADHPDREALVERFGTPGPEWLAAKTAEAAAEAASGGGQSLGGERQYLWHTKEDRAFLSEIGARFDRSKHQYHVSVDHPDIDDLRERFASAEARTAWETEQAERREAAQRRNSVLGRAASIAGIAAAGAMARSAFETPEPTAADAAQVFAGEMGQDAPQVFAGEMGTGTVDAAASQIMPTFASEVTSQAVGESAATVAPHAAANIAGEMGQDAAGVFAGEMGRGSPADAAGVFAGEMGGPGMGATSVAIDGSEAASEAASVTAESLATQIGDVAGSVASTAVHVSTTAAQQVATSTTAAAEAVAAHVGDFTTSATAAAGQMAAEVGNNISAGASTIAGEVGTAAQQIGASSAAMAETVATHAADLTTSASVMGGLLADKLAILGATSAGLTVADVAITGGLATAGAVSAVALYRHSTHMKEREAVADAAPWTLTPREFASVARQRYTLQRSETEDGRPTAWIVDKESGTPIFGMESAEKGAKPSRRDVLTAAHLEMVEAAHAAGAPIPPRVIEGHLKEAQRILRSDKAAETMVAYGGRATALAALTDTPDAHDILLNPDHRRGLTPAVADTIASQARDLMAQVPGAVVVSPKANRESRQGLAQTLTAMPASVLDTVTAVTLDRAVEARQGKDEAKLMAYGGGLKAIGESIAARAKTLDVANTVDAAPKSKRTKAPRAARRSGPEM